MRFSAFLSEAVTSLRLNAMRSGLTAIGVIIGVAGIIVLGAANGGATKRLEAQIAQHGTDNLDIYPTPAANAGLRGPAVLLTDEDAAAIVEHVDGIEVMSREIDGQVTIVAGNKAWTTYYWGVEATYDEVDDLRMAEGRFFDDSEVRASAKVVVLGATVARKLFEDSPAVGTIVRIEGVPAKIIGVQTKVGTFAGNDRDDHVYVPITTARTRLPQPEKTARHKLDYINVKTRADASREAVKAEILALLRERKHIGEGEQDKFDIFDATQTIELMSTTERILSGLLAATALISLMTGGVGIMNIMLVSVTERTHEIGLRMAVGARRRDILAQFLTEAVVLCLVAGAAGIGLGAVGGYIVAKVAEWPLVVGPGTIAAALLSSAGVGIVFGYVPAYRAAALDPIDALRRD